MKNSKHDTTPRIQLRAPTQEPKLVGEWQQRGPETLPGYFVRKLRLTLAPSQLAVAASARS